MTGPAGQDFEGRVVLVTGGAHGVGRAVVTGFAERGAHVIVNWLRAKAEAEATLAELTGAGLSVEAIRASVARQDAVKAMFREIRERHGRLDVLVNNAARGTFLPLGELTEKDWERTLTTSFHGLRWCCQEALPLMAGGGAIVNMSSIGARLVTGNYACMGVAKAAVETYTRYLACELAPRGIRVNAASASFVEGPVLSHFPRADELREVTTRATPAGSLVPPEELCAVVMFLASDAALHLTGQTVLVDGGLSSGAAMLSPPAAPARHEEPPAAPAPPEEPLAAPAPREEPEQDDRHRHGAPGRPPGRREKPVVAIVGTGIAVPGASSPEQLWELLHTSTPVFTEPADRFAVEDFWSADQEAEDRAYVRVSGFLHDFSPHPRLRRELDEGTVDPRAGSTALWLRHCLWQATASVAGRAGDRVACVVGQSVDGNLALAESVAAAAVLDWVKRGCGRRGEPEPDPGELLALIRAQLPRAEPDPARLLPATLMRTAARGLLPSDTEFLAVDAACASSLYALDIGARRLLDGACDLVLCGGCYENVPRSLVLMSKLRTLSPTQRVRCFHDEGDGTLFTDSAVLVALKLLDRARADGDDVLAVLDGFGAASDGRGKAIYAPSPTGQTLAIDRALRARGPERARPDWIIAHATGTAIGHAVEARAIQDTCGTEPLPVTSNKTLLGHTGWSAGVVSVVHAVEALRRGAIPAQQPPKSWSAPGTAPGLHIPAADIPWPRSPGARRTVGISAFGFGGINAHVLLADAPAADTTDTSHRGRG